ncbi:MAG: ABC transporter permease [Anaerolineales bacterium]|nr:ABC transporter permease [Anaerolineales bacterium]
MLLLRFMLRHMFLHWRINLVMLSALTLTVALLAGLPVYAETMAASSLHQALLSHTAPIARNLLVSAQAESDLDERLYGAISGELGDIILERISVRQAILPDYQAPPQAGEAVAPQRFHFYHLWAFDDLERRVRVLEGRLPLYTPGSHLQASQPIPVLEAAIGADGANRTGLKIGDSVRAIGPQGPVALTIVGIIDPLEHWHDLWWDDPRTFSIHVKLLGRSKELFTVSLHVPQQALLEYFPEHESSWRILLDGERISAANALQIQEDISSLQTRFRSQNVELSSGLPAILDGYRGELSTVRTVLFLLTAQAFVFALYTLWMIAAFLLDRSERDLVALIGRGASQLHISLVFAVQGLLLAFLAATLLGPRLALGAIQLWASANGLPAPWRFPPESWRLALGAAFLGWLAIVLQIYAATGQSLFARRRWLAHSPQQAGWPRLYLDVILLFLGGLAYWQLTQTGGFVANRLGADRLVDPFLLLSTSVLLLAAALVCLRILPYLLDLAAWMARQGRGLVACLGLAHLARAPLAPSRVILLVSLAAALTLFANAFIASLERSQAITARYLAGADMRLSSDKASATAIVQSASGLPGVRVVSPATRARFTRLESKSVDLLGIDPATFPQVAYSLSDPAVNPLASLAQVLQFEPGESALPAIFSQALLTTQHQVGQRLLLTVAGKPLEFEIRAIVADFPTLSENFVVTDLHALARQVDLDTLYFSSEAWLSVDSAEPAQYQALLDDPRLEGRILAAAPLELRRLQADAMAQGISGAFQLSALILGLLSAVGFLVAHYLSTQQRIYEFGLLRAMGLATNQAFSLFIIEGLLMVALGLLAGAAIGYGLVRITFPYISRALVGSLAGVTIQQIVIDWGAISGRFAMLVACYILGMFALLLALARSGLHRVLRLGEE